MSQTLKSKCVEKALVVVKFKSWIVLYTDHYLVDIDIIENNYVILWTEIYPVDSAMHVISKLDQYFNLILLTKMYFSVWGLNP